VSKRFPERIRFRAGEKPELPYVLSIIQGGQSDGRPGFSVEVSYYDPDEALSDMAIMSFVTLEELRNVITDIVEGDTPDEIRKKYKTNFDREYLSR
tara:strand:+ start:243 stop:530 length:288 start_codon:yes stop_codon:yes gene_type:complete